MNDKTKPDPFWETGQRNEPNPGTAEAKVLAYLRAYYTITPKQAWLDLGIYRLGAAIFRLRGRGYPISTTLVNVRNKFDETIRIARYDLH